MWGDRVNGKKHQHIHHAPSRRKGGTGHVKNQNLGNLTCPDTPTTRPPSKNAQKKGLGDGPGERPESQGDSPGPKNQPGPKTQNENEEKLKPVKKMNKFWEDLATKNKAKHEKLGKKEENKEKSKPNLGKSPPKSKMKT